MTGLDSEPEAVSPASAAEWRAFLVKLVLFVAIAAAVWLALDVVQNRLPYLTPGADVVSDKKFAILARRRLFGPADQVKVLAFGNSKTMAGIVPATFDQAAGAGVRLYNLGLPGRGDFLGVLKVALKSGNRPDYILLQIPWDQAKLNRTLQDAIPSDHDTIQTLAPFRSLIRNLFVFEIEARKHGGFSAAYRDAAADASSMLAQDGYYFIKAQSHYPHDQLPADYRLPTDTPTVVSPRQLQPKGLDFAELRALQRTYGFKVILTPAPERVGEFAPPAARPDGLLPVPGAPGMFTLGPDYWLYPPDHFADPIHLNPPGAQLFSQRLGQMFGAAIGGRA